MDLLRRLEWVPISTAGVFHRVRQKIFFAIKTPNKFVNVHIGLEFTEVLYRSKFKSPIKNTNLNSFNVQLLKL